MVTKHVADSLSTVLETEEMRLLRDRTQGVDTIRSVIDTVLGWWRYDLYSRKPGPAVVDGEFVGTDLDLACFLSALVDRKAVINLPTYKARRASTKKAGERVISKNDRHGHVTGMTANQAALSFSIRVHDMNVVTQDQTSGEEKIGAPRNFMLVDVDGTWHEGWRRIEFSPTAKENDFLNDKSLWTGNTVVFKNFVHPNRWISLYGRYYFITKALIERLSEQASFLGREVKRLEAEHPGLVAEREGSDYTPPEVEKGESKPIEVDAFEAEIDFGGFEGEFQAVDDSPNANLVSLVAEAKALRKAWVYSVIPQLRFAVRSVELAFFKHGLSSDKGLEKLPAWIKNASWERGFKNGPKARTKWNRLVLGQPAVGERGIALRYRIYKKTERVALK